MESSCKSSASAGNSPENFLVMLTLGSTFCSSSINLANVTQKVLEISLGVANDARFLFYFVSPYETMFDSLKSTPRYITKMYPAIVALVLFENAIRLLKGKRIYRINDTFASLASGIFQECLRIHIRSIELLCYCYIYEHFRLTTFAWNSIGTWVLTFLLVDWGFYWFHRMAHEVNFMWAIHQAHHSGEEFNILGALRQALLQPFIAWIAYTPVALLGIPPPIFLVHLQLSELYMIWIHTEAVGSLPLGLEQIFNTAAHHRVHHARNRRYIDKNYGATLIIWDRFFGTFEQEEPEQEPPIFGLVTPVQSYNILYLQFHSWAKIAQRFWSTSNWSSKFSILLKGPSWDKEKPRLGYIDEIPLIVSSKNSYWNPQIPTLTTIYCLGHLLPVLILYEEASLGSHAHVYDQWTLLGCTSSVVLSLTSLGLLFEGRPWAWKIEFLRILGFLFLQPIIANPLNTLEFGSFRYLDPEFRKFIPQLIRLGFLVSIIFCLTTEFLERKRRRLLESHKLL